MPVGQVSGHRLNDERQKPVDAGDQPHLGQGQVHCIHEGREQGGGKGAVKVTREMDQGQGEQDFEVGILVGFQTKQQVELIMDPLNRS